MTVQASTVTVKGQVTIPSSIREELAIEPGEKVVFVLEENIVKLYPAASFFDFKGSVASKKPFSIKKMRGTAKKHISIRYGKTPRR